jgi:ankyrin repeat protein
MRRLLGVQVAVIVGVVAVVSAQSTAPVADAARRGDQAAVRALLKQGADVNAPQGDGMTALHWAAERGDAALADMLLYAGANAGAATRLGGYTPLHIASRNGHAVVVRALLKAGAIADRETAVSGSTALHLAAAAGSVDAVTALLDAGADIEAKENEWEQTPLIFAAAADRSDVVALLLKRGAKVDQPSRALEISKQQALDRQASQLQRQILQSSVARGEKPTATQQQAAVQAARELMLTGKAPEPPQPGAAGGRGGRGGGGPDGPPNAGRGGRGAGAGNAEPPDAPPSGRQGGRQAGTGGADGTGQTPPADRLNEEGPPPNIAAKGGLTPLHHAARQGFTRTAVALIEAGADINRPSADGHTPLLISLINGQFDFAIMMIERGADVNIRSMSHGVTPLWSVVNTRWQPRTRFPQPQEMEYQKATYLDVMKALLEAGADPNARVMQHPWYMVYTGCGNGNCGLTNVTGSTPFWRAAYGVDVEAMRLLVKYGADPNIPTMTAARGGGGGRGGGRGGGGGGGGRGGGGAAGPAGPDPSGLPPVPPGGPGVFPIHAASGVEYGEGFAGNAHRHAPEGWLPAVKYLVEELGADVNMRDDGGYTPLHHAAARGDNEMILYLVSKGADVKAVSRRGQTTADMANGPVSRISPFPETIELLVKLGAINNNRCQSCVP